jgi:flagellar biosynthesis/type III secretory pathway protein FliH
MAVIKRERADVVASGAVVLDLADIARQGEAMLDAARREAASIVAAARAERDRLIADASQTGHAEGLARGLREGRATGEAEGRSLAHGAYAEKLAGLVAAWTEALGELQRRRDHLLVECRREVLAIALEIAGRVTHRVVSGDDRVVCDQIEAALRLAVKPTRAVIAIAPEDEAMARAELPAIVERLTGIEAAELVVDPALGAGSCTLRTAAGGEVDASVRTQLDRIAAVLVPGLMPAVRIESSGGEPGEIAA